MSFAELRSRLAGVVAIPVTPFDEHDEIDDEAYANILTRMCDGGIDVMTPGGNTGEYYSLTEQEIRHTIEMTVSVIGSRCVVLAGVGQALPNAIRAAVHARDAGANAVMVHQPVHPYLSRDGWVEYHRRIANAVPDLGIVLYLRDPRIDGATIARLADAAPNVIAVKYGVPDVIRLSTLVRECQNDQIVWIAGLAELHAPSSWAAGVTGFTSGFANVMPGISLRMLDSLRAGDFHTAMGLWELIRPFEELRLLNGAENNVSVVKEALAQLDLCRRDVRPPISTVSLAERDRVTQMLGSWRQALESEGSA